jgi:serralysin
MPPDLQAKGPVDADPFPVAPMGATALSALSTSLGPQAYLNADARATAITDVGKVSYTISQAAVNLTGGDPNNPNGGQPGWSSTLQTPYTVTYAYRASAPFNMPSDTGGFSRFDQAQIDQAEQALKAWSDVANIHFVRVGFGDTGDMAYSDNATILLGNYSTGEDGASAFTFYPGGTSSSDQAGDVWINNTFGYNANPAIGNYGATVLVHELGHAIGLTHPSDYNAAADQTLTYAADASYYEDDRQYTVMSYFSEANTGANFRGAYPAAPMLDDIAAAQLEYGANMSTRTDDTVYGFNSNTGEAWLTATSASTKLVAAIWDAGGTDTIDVSGYSQDQLIDLRAGDFSNVGGLTGNLAIAKGVTIEKAIGGSGNDVIHGNGVGNSIQGGAGADTIDDGGAGNSQLYGGEGDDSITGGSGADDVNGNKGQDTIDGGSGGADSLLGGQGNDLIASHAGASLVAGNIGADTLFGGTGPDTLRGGQGDDSIAGGSGNEQIWGDLGNDTLRGGAGADTFHLRVGDGQDVVVDFNAAEGDRVQLDPGVTYTETQVGSDTVITLLGSGDTLTLQGVDSSSLPAGAIFLA